MASLESAGVRSAGHYALTENYKLGSVPLKFDYGDTVQSGITVNTVGNHRKR
jgi:hypothetical protein